MLFQFHDPDFFCEVSFIFLGQITPTNKELVLVSNSIENFSACCKFFEENIYIDVVHTPTGTKISEISQLSLIPELCSLHIKWLGFECKVRLIWLCSLINALKEIKKLSF